MTDHPRAPHPADPAREQRDRRRAFVLAHHPDRGGDPEVFRAGLPQFDRVAAPSVSTVIGASTRRGRRRRRLHVLTRTLRAWRPFRIN